jgi:AcrR family transcriptional regulator
MRRRHPTSSELLRTAVALLDEFPPDDITVEMVLSRAGVSKGSMYHHYRDFADLMDVAEVARFSAMVDEFVTRIADVVITARTREEFFDGLVGVTAANQAASGAGARSTRVWTLGQAGLRTSMRDALGAEQQRLTDSLADLVRTAQSRGWVVPDLEAQAVAVFIQAYTVGRAVDDVTPRPLDPRAWELLVNTVIAETLMGDRSLVARAQPSAAAPFGQGLHGRADHVG